MESYFHPVVLLTIICECMYIHVVLATYNHALADESQQLLIQKLIEKDHVYNVLEQKKYNNYYHL